MTAPHDNYQTRTAIKHSLGNSVESLPENGGKPLRSALICYASAAHIFGAHVHKQRTAMKYIF